MTSFAFEPERAASAWISSFSSCGNAEEDDRAAAC